jgi:hypothetical protein
MGEQISKMPANYSNWIVPHGAHVDWADWTLQRSAFDVTVNADSNISSDGDVYVALPTPTLVNSESVGLTAVGVKLECFCATLTMVSIGHDDDYIAQFRNLSEGTGRYEWTLPTVREVECGVVVCFHFQSTNSDAWIRLSGVGAKFVVPVGK